MVDSTSEWAGAGITIAVLVGAVILVKVGGVTSERSNTGIASIFGRFFFAIANFIPFGLILFGFIADMISQELRYTISSLVGILTIILNYFIGGAVSRNSSTPPMAGGADSRWCSIPGLEGLESTTLPMNISSTTAIVLYYVWFAMADRPMDQNISLFAGLGAILVAQMISFASSGCSSYYTAISGKMGYNVLGAIILGVVASAIAFSSVNWGAHQYSPFATVAMAPPTKLLGPGGTQQTVKSGLSAPPTGGKCSPIEGGEEDAMVCEAYRNGQLVTDTLT
jgi:hypothetical protein